MAKKHRMTGPGVVHDRKVRTGTLEIALDVSPNGFVTEARSRKERLILRLAADDMEPIEIQVAPHQWLLKLKDAAIEPGRLADLERLITEEVGVQVTIEYTPKQDNFPGIET